MAPISRDLSEDRDALYSRFPAHKKIRFKHKTCEGIVVDFLNFRPGAAMLRLRKFHPSESEVEVAKILTKLSPCIVWNECDAVLALKEMGSVKMKRGSHFSRRKGKRPKKTSP
jgi:hypothetical protein